MQSEANLLICSLSKKNGKIGKKCDANEIGAHCWYTNWYDENQFIRSKKWDLRIFCYMLFPHLWIALLIYRFSEFQSYVRAVIRYISRWLIRIVIAYSTFVPILRHSACESAKLLILRTIFLYYVVNGTHSHRLLRTSLPADSPEKSFYSISCVEFRSCSVSVKWSQSEANGKKFNWISFFLIEWEQLTHALAIKYYYVCANFSVNFQIESWKSFHSFLSIKLPTWSHLRNFSLLAIRLWDCGYLRPGFSTVSRHQPTIRTEDRRFTLMYRDTIRSSCKRFWSGSLSMYDVFSRNKRAALSTQ